MVKLLIELLIELPIELLIVLPIVLPIACIGTYCPDSVPQLCAPTLCSDQQVRHPPVGPQSRKHRVGAQSRGNMCQYKQ